jgi:hypothetical protein
MSKRHGDLFLEALAKRQRAEVKAEVKTEIKKPIEVIVIDDDDQHEEKKVVNDSSSETEEPGSQTEPDELADYQPPFQTVAPTIEILTDPLWIQESALLLKVQRQTDDQMMQCIKDAWLTILNHPDFNRHRHSWKYYEFFGCFIAPIYPPDEYLAFRSSFKKYTQQLCGSRKVKWCRGRQQVIHPCVSFTKSNICIRRYDDLMNLLC